MPRKLLFLILSLVILASNSHAATVVCDFDGSQAADDTDLIVMLAYLQVKGLAAINLMTLDLASVQTTARNILQNNTLTLTRLPDESTDDLESQVSSTLGDNDLILFLAYLQTKGLAAINLVELNFSNVENNASTIRGSALSLGQFPGTPTGNSTLPIRIEGIQPDN